jgi:hypothetical protein
MDSLFLDSSLVPITIGTHIRIKSQINTGKSVFSILPDAICHLHFVNLTYPKISNFLFKKPFITALP